MTSIFRRKGRPGWTLKFIDAGGRVRFRAFKTREAAKEEDRRLHGGVQPGEAVTLTEYAERWLRQVAPGLRPGSLRNYGSDLRLHILPTLGHRPMRTLRPGDVKDLLSAKRATLAKHTVLNLKATLHACLAEAVADGFIGTNPATLRGRGRSVQLRQTRAERATKIRALDADQLRAFLAACRTVAPAWWPYYRLMAVTGMRPGEALALKWEDLDLAGRRALVRRGWTEGLIQPTKSGEERAVDLSAALADDLAAWKAQQAARALQRGASAPEWLFPAQSGRPRSHDSSRLVFAATLKAAKLPASFSPHSLRHTYASLQLQRGVSIYYVQRQLGHASIQMTVDHYGRWLPAVNPGAADDLDAQLGNVTSVSPSAQRKRGRGDGTIA